MAPTQLIEVKDLPQELIQRGGSAEPATESAVDAVSHAGAAETAPVFASHGGGVAKPLAPSNAAAWEALLAGEARTMLESGQPEVMDLLTRRFEKAVLEAALGVTRGRRVEAATRLGIGRNTITRKLQELGFD
jgi:two-component system nitrogen regulation response regulator GlnG